MAIENVGDQMNMGNQPRVKAEKFDAFMKEREVSGFHKEEYDDQFRTVIYFSGLQTAGQQQFVQVLLNDSIYGMIKVLVGHKAVNEENRGRVLEYLNQLNQRFGAFKYIVTPDGNLELDCSLIANDETFDPEVIMVMLLNVIQPHLESELLRLPAVVGGPVGVHVGEEEAVCAKVMLSGKGIANPSPIAIPWTHSPVASKLGALPLKQSRHDGEFHLME